MSHWKMMYFQDPSSPISDNLNLFHNFIMIFLIMISSLVLFIMIDIIMNKFSNRFLLKNHSIEIIWTISPMIILMIIAIPSLKTLYYIDELWYPIYLTIKSIGNQWYWSYEYPEFNNIDFDSYMEKDMSKLNLFRLLDVDNRLIIPYNTPIRLLTSSNDVIHSWAIPSLGIKIDSIPGRINQMNLFVSRPGIYFGQCSEICGTNHSFMPIVIESTNCYYFLKWITSFK